MLQYIRGLEKRIQELEDEKLNSKQMVIKLHIVLYFYYLMLLLISNIYFFNFYFRRIKSVIIIMQNLGVMEMQEITTVSR